MEPLIPGLYETPCATVAGRRSILNPHPPTGGRRVHPEFKPVTAVRHFLRRPCGPYLTRSDLRMRNVAYSQGQAEYALGPTGYRPTHPAGVVVLTRKIAGRPYGVAVARDGSTYVAANGLAFSPANRRPIRTVWVGGTPRNVTFDALGTTALVTTEEAVVFIR